MKKIRKHILLHFLCTICLSSCIKQYPEELLLIEDMIDKYPENAFAMLDSLQIQLEKEPQSTVMYYNLLLAETCEKCNMPYLNDSLVPSLSQYYEKTNEKKNLMKSYYFMGQRHLNLSSQEAPTAFAYFLKAQDIATATKEYAFLGRIHNRIGQSFIKMDLSKIAIPNYQKALHFYLVENDSLNSISVLRNLAKAYDSLSQTDSTLYYFQQAYDFAKANGSKEEEVVILQELASIYIRINRCDDALELLQKSTELQNEQQRLDYNIWANLFLKNEQKDSATAYFEKEIENNNSLIANKHAYWNLFQLEKEDANYEQGLEYLEKYIQCSDSIYQYSNIQSLQRIKALYDLHHIETEKENLRKENQEQRTWIMGIMAAIAIVTGLLIHYYKIKKSEAREQEKKLQNIHDEQYLRSRQYIEDNNKKIKELAQKIEIVQQEKDELLQKLLLAQKEKLEQANQAIEISRKEQALLEESLRRSVIYARCYQAIENPSITLTNDDWSELTLAVNETYDNFTNRLFVLHPSITRMELHICLLVKIQLPASTISQLVYRTQSAISMSRKQLYKKIFKKDGTPAQLDDFILSF